MPGDGAAGSGLYVDPGREPLAFLAAAAWRLPVLLAGDAYPQGERVAVNGDELIIELEIPAVFTSAELEPGLQVLVAGRRAQQVAKQAFVGVTE